jgi:O-antigen/teichoic acid export membrane protein
MSVSRFISESILLLSDKLTVAVASWFYWILIAKFTFLSEVGQATTIYSYVSLITALTQLGLEYPLLKKASVDKSQILWTVLTIELTISILILPLAIYSFTGMSEGSLQRFIWILIGIFISNQIAFVTRFVLLGISKTRTVFAIDIIGIGIRFGVSFVFIVFTNSLDAFELLLSVFLQTVFVAVACLIFSNNAFHREKLVLLGGLAYIKKATIEGVINMPSKLSSGSLIASLCVTLLAFFGVPISQIGAFYIAMITSIVAGGGLASSMASMAIPASVISKTDLSSTSSRINISLTAPIIAILVSSPEFVLSLVGHEYIEASTILLILSTGILPYSIVTNAISKFNFLNLPRRIIFVGTLQILTFSIGFILLVPIYGTYGAGFSITAAFCCSAIPSTIWLGRGLIRYIATSALAIMLGWAAGYAITSWDDSIINDTITIIVSGTITLIAVIGLKNITLDEIRQLLGTLHR